jgi:hypothetical protein
MTEPKTSANAPPAEPQPSDSRLIPGGSFRSARTQIGMTGVDHYTERPGPKADLPDLSETPGWHMVPKTDRRA